MYTSILSVDVLLRPAAVLQEGLAVRKDAIWLLWFLVYTGRSHMRMMRKKKKK
jgi:hypothetical protein